MAGACEHQTETTSPSVIATDDCTVKENAIAFVREGAPRRTSAATAKGGVLVPQFAFTPRNAGSVSRYERGRRPFVELRPLALALRI